MASQYAHSFDDMVIKIFTWTRQIITCFTCHAFCPRLWFKGCRTSCLKCSRLLNTPRFVLSGSELTSHRFLSETFYIRAKELETLRPISESKRGVVGSWEIFTWTWTNLAIFLIWVWFFVVITDTSFCVPCFRLFNCSITWKEGLHRFVVHVWLCVCAWTYSRCCQCTCPNSRSHAFAILPINCTFRRFFHWLFVDQICTRANFGWIIHKPAHFAYVLRIFIVMLTSINYWCQKPTRNAWHWHFLETRVTCSSCSSSWWHCLEHWNRINHSPWCIFRSGTLRTWINEVWKCSFILARSWLFWLLMSYLQGSHFPIMMSKLLYSLVKMTVIIYQESFFLCDSSHHKSFFEITFLFILSRA